MAKKLLKTIFFYFKLATSNDDQQLDEDDINELKCVEEDDEDKSSCSWSQQPNSSVTNLLLSPIGVPNICLKLIYSMFKVAVHNDMSNISVSLCDMYVGQFFVSFDIK